MRQLAIIALCLASGTAMAAEHSQDYHCRPLAETKAGAESAGAKFVAMTPEQWQFARGVAAVLPMTPNGLPPGDHGALLIGPDGDGALIFIDGDQACEGIQVYKVMIDLELSVGAGDIVHAPTSEKPL